MGDAEAFERDGYAILRDVVAVAECAAMGAALQPLRRAGAGSRRLLAAPWCRELALRLKRDARIRNLLPPDALAVQCTLFDKSAVRNWLVALHQDLSVPVERRTDSSECGGWSSKENMLFVQPPAWFLARCVALRLHIDPCGPDNGPLRVVPGSHRDGRLSDAQAVECHRLRGEASCELPCGAVLAMRPLLHASSKTSAAGPRRVLHYLFVPSSPPCGLRWAEAV